MDYKKSYNEKDTDGRSIADLCRMCGQCCRAIATEFTHEELIKMSKNNEKEAKIFVEFFKQYKNIEEVKKIAPEHVKQVLKHKYISEDSVGNEVSFYYCEKISPDNKCSIHTERPICCRRAPQDGWAVMPPGCGYAGWQLEERERIKSNIRSMKEKIYEIEMLEGENAFIEELNMSLKDLKKFVEEKSEPFRKYGSKGW